MPEGALLTQVAYVKEILEMTGQEESTPIHVPMYKQDPSYSILKIDGKEDKQRECISLNQEEHHLYREYIGKLM